MDVTEKVKKQRKERMVMLSVRVPAKVATYFHDNYVNASKQVRVALEEYVTQEERIHGNNT